MSEHELLKSKRIKIKSYQRFALVDKKTLSPATHYHQDDMEDPVVADTLDGLISIAAEWNGTSKSDFLRALHSDEDVSGYKIIVEEVSAYDISDDDLIEFQQRLIDCETEGLTKI